MKLVLAAILPGRGRSGSGSMGDMRSEYVRRIGHYCTCSTQQVETEAALFTWLERQSGRTAAHVVLLDSRGKQFSSAEFAANVGRLRDGGTQTLVLAIGPADGWSAEARGRADMLLSLGPMTLPHELAMVVLAEQVYRAFTILAGHPYHSGH